MIRLPAVPAPLDTTSDDLPRLAASLLGIPASSVQTVQLIRRSIDARKKDAIRLALTLDVSVQGNEDGIFRRCKHPNAALVPSASPALVPCTTLAHPPKRRPIVVGAGPAGLFAAWTLARAGATPLLIDRGRDAHARRKDVDSFWAGGALLPHSNAVFGEGGAGTFSDGKLNTGIKDPRCAYVLDVFARCGAPGEIRYQAKPHIGTDHLVEVVAAMRQEIIRMGGIVQYQTRLSGIHVENGALRGVQLEDREVETDLLILAIGHSARDTCAMLYGAGVPMQLKPFSIGARIEHPQRHINAAQYGRFAGHPALGAADYKLSTRSENGRGVYTFCMCPGGEVVAAASEPGGVVTNGMSRFARDGENANSALLVDVRPEDLDGDDPLAGIRFQRHWEQLAFQAGGGGFHAPAQQVGDFLQGRPSKSLDGPVRASYRPGVTPANLRDCLPVFVHNAMAEAIVRMDRQLRGFAMPEAILTGVETRSSSPVRILRDAEGQSAVRGLFPAGEGAGYAGGIMSAAVDGIRAAENVLRALEENP